MPLFTAIGRMFTPSKQDAPRSASVPKIGDAAAAGQKASVKKRKAVGTSETTKTSPLGISGEAAITKKVLLGQ